MVLLSLHAQPGLSSNVCDGLVLPVDMFPLLPEGGLEFFDFVFAHLVSSQLTLVLGLAASDLFVLVHLSEILIFLLDTFFGLLQVLRDRTIVLLLPPVCVGPEGSRHASHVLHDVVLYVVGLTLQTHDRLVGELRNGRSLHVLSSILERVD